MFRKLYALVTLNRVDHLRTKGKFDKIGKIIGKAARRGFEISIF